MWPAAPTSRPWASCPPSDITAALAAIGPVRRRRPPRGARGRAVPRAGGGRRRVRRRARRADRPGAPAPAQVARRPRRGHGRRPRGPGGGLLRHGLPRHAAARGGDLRGAGRVARAVRAAPVRLPRPVARLRLPPGDRARRRRRPPGPSGGHVPPRGGGVARRGAGGPVGRHHDGLHAAGGPHDGHAVGHRRPGRLAVADHPPRARPRRGGRRRWSTGPACSAWPARPTWPRWSGAPSAGDEAAGLAAGAVPAPAAGRRSAPWPPASAGSTSSCSPAGVGENAPRCGPRRRAPCRSSAWRSTRRPTPRSTSHAGDPAGVRDISAPGAAARVMVVAAREDLEIARGVRALLT